MMQWSVGALKCWDSWSCSFSIAFFVTGSYYIVHAVLELDRYARKAIFTFTEIHLFLLPK